MFGSVSRPSAPGPPRAGAPLTQDCSVEVFSIDWHKKMYCKSVVKIQFFFNNSDQLYTSPSLLLSLSACIDLHVGKSFFKDQSWLRNKLQLYTSPFSKCNSSMYSCIHQSFVCCQLVDGPKLHYQILIDDHYVDRQPNDVVLKVACSNQRKYIQTKNISSTSCRSSSWSISVQRNPDWKTSLYIRRSLVMIVLIHFLISIHAML